MPCLDVIGTDALHQFVDETAYLADVAGNLGEAFFAGVHFLQDDHGQVDIVLLKTEQRSRVVHQHIGVENEEAF